MSSRRFESSKGEAPDDQHQAPERANINNALHASSLSTLTKIFFTGSAFRGPVIKPSVRKQRQCAECEDELQRQGKEETAEESAQEKSTLHLLRLTQAARPPQLQQTLQHLQRTYGNRHVQGVVTLARESEESAINPEIEQRITRKHGGGRALVNSVRTKVNTALDTDSSGVGAHSQSQTNDSEGATFQAKPKRHTRAANGLTLIHQAKTAGARVQRLDENGGADERVRTPETAPAVTEGNATALIVEDDAATQEPGQMSKTVFLTEVRRAVCEAAEAVLAPTGRGTAGCPYLGFIFAFLERRTANYIERTLRRFDPRLRSARSARDYIPAVVDRIRQSTQHWVETGEITGLPAGLPTRLTLGASASAPETGGAAPAAIQAKAQSRAGRVDRSPAAIREQLGTGRSLDSGVASRMGSVFGVDFSQVRLHDDAHGAQLSQKLNARAFTVGEHIAFNAGEYQPGTPVGDALIAHELAHVIQQKIDGSSTGHGSSSGDVADASLERGADDAATLAVTSIWGGLMHTAADIIRKTKSGLTSGLRLQRCDTRSTGPMNQQRLNQAYRNFKQHNSALTDAETAKIHQALRGVLRNNLNLWITYYDYYSNEDLRKATASELRTWRPVTWGETSRHGATILRPSLLAPAFSNATLGPFLLHEFSHTGDNPNPMGLGDYQEGEAYAIEYFYARRAGNAARARTILDLMRNNPDTVVVPAQIPAMRQLFRTGYATMVGLYEIIDSGRSTRRGSPFVTPSTLSRADARRLVAELVSEDTDQRSQRLVDIMTWVFGNDPAYRAMRL